MRIGQKLGLGFLGIAVLLGIAGGITIRQAGVVKRNIDKMLMSDLGEIKGTSDVLYCVQMIKANIRAFFLKAIMQRTPQEIEYIKETVKNSGYELQKSILFLEDAIKIGVQFAETAEQKKQQEQDEKEAKILKAKSNQFIKLTKKIIILLEEDNEIRSVKIFKSGLEPLSREIQNTTRGLLERKVKGEITKTAERIKMLADNVVRYSVFIFIFILLTVIGLGLFVTKAITEPIIKLKNTADEISRGKVDIKIDIKSKDEIGDLAQSFKRMLASIKFLKEKGENK